VQQHAAFNWFINAQSLQRGVLAAGALPPADLKLREGPAHQRLGWGHVFQLQVLTEPGAARGAAAEPRMRAACFSGDEVMDFMLTRFSREPRQPDAPARKPRRATRCRPNAAITIPLIKSCWRNE
jgi:DnaA family protein